MKDIRRHGKSALIVLATLVIGYILLRRPTSTATVSAPTAPASPAPATPRAGTAPSSSPASAVPPTLARTYEIVTLLPRDAIPAIDDPSFYAAAEADAEYEHDELVLGVILNGESHAYSASHLDRHEIVNDTVGGRKIAVTW